MARHLHAVCGAGVAMVPPPKHNMEMNMTTVTVSTKPMAGHAAHTTALTMDFSTVTREQLEAGFMAYAIVKLQGNWRKNGIPPTATVNAADIAPGKRIAASITSDQALAIVLADPVQRKALHDALIAEEQAKLDAELEAATAPTAE